MDSLKNFMPRKNFIFCIDSDGCVFDTMEIKHKECFCPSFIDYFSLQPISRYARDAWEYTNLYSKSRGKQRFVTLVESLDLLEKRVDVQERNFTVPCHEALRNYCCTAPSLNNDTLQAAIERNPDARDLAQALAWSKDVNLRIGQMVHGVPPFPHVRRCLEEIARYGHIVVVSATPEEALLREWQEHGIDQYVDVICGQETGTKAAVIAQLKAKNPDAFVLMIGDAPGDGNAAHKNSARFYPIRPSDEAASWKELYELLPVIWQGAYDENAELHLVKKFDLCLPDTPPWKSC